jgi:hypothetical protein
MSAVLLLQTQLIVSLYFTVKVISTSNIGTIHRNLILAREFRLAHTEIWMLCPSTTQ